MYVCNRQKLKSLNYKKNWKINCLRKTLKPNFTHTDFPCYVTQSYNIIKPQNINLKYLTGILNSSLIYFWLYHKGKKQGEQLQIDSGPLLKLPLISNKNSEIIKEVDVDRIPTPAVEYVEEVKTTKKKGSNPKGDK